MAGVSAPTRARKATATHAPKHTLFNLDAATYTPHALHNAGRTYLETNCYTDVIIELLHARGDEPLAALGCLVRCDFEGDQWTFFKPPPEDLEALFGIDIHEMQPYRPLPAQIAQQLAAARTLIVELDSFYLPDTAATSYRTEHVKSSIAAEAIDTERGWLRYFHGAGLYELDGADFAGAFRLDGGFAADVLPPYTELVRFDAGPRLRGNDLREAARSALARHLTHRPATNPFERFGEQLSASLPELLAGDLEHYHAYAFATVRMVGAAYELAGAHARWLAGPAADPALAAIEVIVDRCKVLGFRLARRREFDPAPLINELSTAWEEAIAALETLA